jgi:hypothetical protein
MNSVDDFVLVGVTANLRDAKFLRSKLDRYLAALNQPKAIAINDVHGLVRDYFGEALIDSVEPSMSLRDKRRLVSAARWSVYFWDGTAISDYVFLSMLYGKVSKVIAIDATRVVNKERGDEFDVYIGRGTPWGNPFRIEGDIDRATSIRLFEEFFKKKFVDDAGGNRDIRTLRGKVLGCHCKPLACHGDVIAAYLNSLPIDESE